jgi:hypothetical protein
VFQIERLPISLMCSCDVLMVYGAVLYIAAGLARLPEIAPAANRASAAVTSLFMLVNAAASVVLS